MPLADGDFDHFRVLYRELLNVSRADTSEKKAQLPPELEKDSSRGPTNSTLLKNLFMQEVITTSFTQLFQGILDASSPPSARSTTWIRKI